MAPLKNVMIIGASGNVGASVLDNLLRDGTFNISILTRQSSKAIFPPEQRLKVVRISDDFTSSDLLDAFKGQDAVISTIPGSNRKIQLRFIDAAIQVGVKRFIPSEFGGDTLHPGRYEVLPMFKANAEITQYLRRHEGAGLSWSALATGPFFDFAMKRGLLGYDMKTRTATIYDSGDVPFSTTTMATIGAAVVSILHHPDETANRFLFVASFTISQNEILQALEKACQANWTVKHSTTEESVRTGTEKYSKGEGGILQLLLGTIYSNGRGSNFEEDHELDNGLLELPKESLDEVIGNLMG